MEYITGAVVAELLSDTAPIKSQARMLFLDGQYLFQWQEGGQQHFKLLSPVSLRQAFAEEPIDSGWIPPNLVRWGTSSKGEWAIQFVPTEERTIWVEHPKTKVETKITLRFPAFVFSGMGKTYRIFAMKDRTFDPEAKLYHAPLPNVSTTGVICWGNNQVPDASIKGIGLAWKVFWQSAFNSHQVNGKSKKCPDDVRDMLLNVHRYPLPDLVATDYQASDLVKDFE